MFASRSRVGNRDFTMSADTRTNEELLNAARNGDEAAPPSAR
jgi:hypothetical protein